MSIFILFVRAGVLFESAFSLRLSLKLSLRNNFLKYRCEGNKRAYNDQRNLCFFPVTKAKKEDFDNLDHKKVTDNKTFWKTITPLEEILSNSETISETLNTFFSEVVKN